MRVLIVGAGFYGATCARVLTDAGIRCLVIERQPYIAGHCRTETVHEVGCFLHACGPHIFHTSNPAVWRFVSEFARFNGFVNRPKVMHKGRLYSFPINLATLHAVFGVTTPNEAAERLAREREPIAEPQNMEEYCLSTIGRTLYELFIEGYTTKQWGIHPRGLPASIAKRIPVRLNCDDRYFTDQWQGIPAGGYTALIGRMLAGVPLQCRIDFLADRDHWLRGYDRIIYTGAIDEFLGYEFGALEYRSLRFESEILDTADYQGNAVVNYTDAAVPFTRIVEHKHFEEAGGDKTIITREYPAAWKPGDEPFYPVNTADNQARLALYKERAAELPRVVFGGRLGEYRYLDMHQVIAAALDKSDEIARTL
jgi:UDP-galactopyranose mutase